MGASAAGSEGFNERVERIAREAREHPPGAQRNSFLDTACGGDQHLRRAVDLRVAQLDRLPPDITTYLDAINRDVPGARDRLLTLIYDWFKRKAGNELSTDPARHDYDRTDLADEAYVKLFSRKVEWKNSAHFWGALARAIRQVLVDWFRKRNTDKGGGGRKRVPLGDLFLTFDSEHDPNEVLRVADALEELERIDERKAAVFRLRYYFGLTVEEVAAAIAVSEGTVKTDWRAARAWLFKRLGGTDPEAMNG